MKRARQQRPTQRFYAWVGFPYVGHWLVDPGEESEAVRMHYALINGRPLDNPPAVLDFTIAGPGKAMDFGMTAMGVPVVSPGGAELLRRVAEADVQLIPCRIDGEDSGFSVVNIIARLDCIDRARSRLIVPGDPDGIIKDVFYWVIDAARTNGHMLFRLEDDKFTVVIAEPMKREIERGGFVGPGMVELDGEQLRHSMPGLQRSSARGARRPRQTGA